MIHTTPPPPLTLDLSEVAAISGLTLPAVRRLVLARDLPVVRIRGRVRVRLADLAATLQTPLVDVETAAARLRASDAEVAA